MLLGLSLAAFTWLHVIISLIAIAAGVVFFLALAAGRWRAGTNRVFLVFTILTSVTGFLFPPKPIGPPFIFGVISLVLLAIALYALLARRRAGPWHRVFVAAALVAQWLNMIVLVVQSFQKIPALNALAPTGAEPPVLAAQTALLLAIGWIAWRTLLRPVVPRAANDTAAA